jgi:hypothetical protein
MTRDTAGPNWTSILTQGSSTVTSKFPLAYKNFNQVWQFSLEADRYKVKSWLLIIYIQAILAIELTGVSWDFGKLVWNDVVMASRFTSTLANHSLTVMKGYEYDFDILVYLVSYASFL